MPLPRQSTKWPCGFCHAAMQVMRLRFASVFSYDAVCLHLVLLRRHAGVLCRPSARGTSGFAHSSRGWYTEFKSGTWGSPRKLLVLSNFLLQVRKFLSHPAIIEYASPGSIG